MANTMKRRGQVPERLCLSKLGLPADWMLHTRKCEVCRLIIGMLIFNKGMQRKKMKCVYMNQINSNYNMMECFSSNSGMLKLRVFSEV